MTVHDRVLELAAAAIDFPLTPAERRELDEHVSGCPICRRNIAALRADATAVLTPVAPLPVERSQVILAGALRRRRSGAPIRMLAIAALFALGTGAALAVGAQLLQDSPTETPPVVVRPSETPSAEPSISAPPPSASPEPSVAPSAPPSQPTTEPSQPPASQPPVAGPIQADARGIGAGIELTPAANGGAFVTVPGDSETALFRLDSDGAIAPGWPIFLPNAPCAQPLAVEDGSVRVLCVGPLDELGQAATHRAYAVDASGRALPGWPVDAPCCVETMLDQALDQRMDGTTLRFVANRYTTDALVPGEPVGVIQLVEIDAAGSVTVGAEIDRLVEQVTVVLGPGQVAYVVQVAYVNGSPTMEATAFDPAGVVEGWSVALGEWSSPPAFLPDGRIAFVTTEDGAGQLRVFGPDGTAAGDVEPLPFQPRAPWSGAGDFLYSPVLVAPDGTLRVVSSDSKVWSLDPDQAGLPGWSWQPASLLQQSGYCDPGDTGCGQADVELAIGPDGEVVVAVEATDTGGALVTVDADGTVREGWPVTLNRVGSAFWQVVSDASGVTYALAIEPEGDAGFSGTILRLEPDSTVSWATTLVEP